MEPLSSCDARCPDPKFKSSSPAQRLRNMPKFWTASSASRRLRKPPKEHLATNQCQMPLDLCKSMSFMSLFMCKCLGAASRTFPQTSRSAAPPGTPPAYRRQVCPGCRFMFLCMCRMSRSGVLDGLAVSRSTAPPGTPPAYRRQVSGMSVRYLHVTNRSLEDSATQKANEHYKNVSST